MRGSRWCRTLISACGTVLLFLDREASRAAASSPPLVIPVVVGL
jgi:hypothetical protein